MNIWTAHELEHQRAQFSAAIDHSDVAMLALDTSGRVVMWTAGMAGLTGMPADEAIGHVATDLFTLRSEDGTVVGLTERPSGTPMLTTQDGRALWVEISCSSSADTSAAGLLTAVFVDKSAKRQLDYIRHLLLVSVHHELQGPLTTIRGHAQLLGTTVTDRDGAESLGAILDSVEMMQHVIADLVLIEGDRSARPAPADEPIETRHLLRRTVQSLPSVASRTLIDAPSQVVLRGDPVRLRQCLLLILSNAEKYAPSGAITVTVREDAGYGVIEIADEGPGIPDEEQHLALTPYYRSAATHDLPGSGLGLHIADVLMTSMRGRIKLASAPSGGLLVALWLPLASVEGPDGSGGFPE